MKDMKYIIYLFLSFLIIYKIRAEDNKYIEYRCGADDEKFVPIVSNREMPIDHNSNIYRRRMDELDSDGFKNLNMYIDFENLEFQIKENDIENYRDLIISSLLTANETLGKLFKVKPHQKDDWMSDIQINNFDIYHWEKDKFGDEAYNNNVTFFTTGIDMAIFGRISDSKNMGSSTLASAVITYLEASSGLPYAGRITINKDLIKEGANLKLHLEEVFIHEFTHILGFSSGYLLRYSNNQNFKRVDKNGISRTYINTTKVIEVAKKYFNCSHIDGIPLEEHGGSGTAGSHWETRLLYGEYMTGSIFHIDFVISEFTLALLEDFGNYKANYYTGGLMRFGKNKGCEFITENCIDSEHMETNFKNEFFDNIYYAYIYDMDPSCSSGRQGKTYNWFTFEPTVPEYYDYFNNQYIGLAMADYCPVAKSYSSETSKNYFAGHCSKLGVGVNYGDPVYYYLNIDGQDRYVHYDNSQYENITGEIYSNISFCYLSSLIKKTESLSKLFSQMFRAICFQTFCSSRSLTVKIFNDYIVCPRTGGKIEIDSYEGYLLCPDYNLICSGTVLCNNILECIDKKSEPKEESYYYDYEILTTQDIEIAEIDSSKDEDNYELSDDGKCPKFCKVCNENRKCIKCAYEYVFVGFQNSEEILCMLEEELTHGYYKVEDNFYFKCSDNCLECSDGNSCEECENGYDLIDNLCVPRILNCEVYKDENECVKCKDNYAFERDIRNECFSIDTFDEYYTMDGGISYYPCDGEKKNWDTVLNCKYCYYKRINTIDLQCYFCRAGYILLDDETQSCFQEQDYNKSGQYFYVNSTHMRTCIYAIENCLRCASAQRCIECLNNHYYLNNKTDRCYSLSELTPSNEFYQVGNYYYSCNNSNFHIISHCKKCYSKLDCILCEDNYTFINGNKFTCVEINSLENKYFKDPEDESNYISCSNLIDNCNLCNNTQCIKCDEDYIFIDDNFDSCELKSSINLSLYFTNDEIVYYSCNNEKYKNNPKCQMINPIIIKTTIPNIESTTPNTETTTPSIEATTLNTETTTPSTQTTSPNIETTTPNTETITPNTEATTPSTQTTSPNIETTTPNIETTTPSSQTITPNAQTTTPNNQNNIPNTETTTPNIQSTILSTQTTTPNIETTSPNTKTTTPSTETTIPIETTVIQRQIILAKFDNPYKKPIFFLQAQLKNNLLELFLLINFYITNDFSLIAKINIYSAKTLRFLQTNLKKGLEVEMLPFTNTNNNNGIVGFRTEDIFQNYLDSLSDDEKLILEIENININNNQTENYYINLGKEVDMLNTLKVSNMIKENKVIDFENVANNNNNYIVNQYQLLSISEGCEFTLTLDKQITIKNKELELEFKKTEISSNNLYLKCSASSENNKQIKCSLNEYIDSKYTFNDYIYYDTNELVSITSANKESSYLIKCIIKKKTKLSKTSIIFIIIFSVIFVIVTSIVIFIKINIRGKKMNDYKQNNTSYKKKKNVEYSGDLNKSAKTILY